jgi:hypothetical protein
MSTPIKGMVFPGGYHFFEGDVRLDSHFDLDNLYEVVKAYRANNNLPVGDVVGDVNRQLCGRVPTFCHGVDSVEVNFSSVERPTPQGDLLNDVVTWASNLLATGEQIKLVSDTEASRRSSICAACPNNANFRGGCTPCIDNALRVCASVRQARDVGMSKILGGCHVLRHDNRTAIFIEKDQLSKARNLPDSCWMNEA